MYSFSQSSQLSPLSPLSPLSIISPRGIISPMNSYNLHQSNPYNLHQSNPYNLHQPNPYNLHQPNPYNLHQPNPYQPINMDDIFLDPMNVRPVALKQTITPIIMPYFNRMNMNNDNHQIGKILDLIVQRVINKMNNGNISGTMLDRKGELQQLLSQLQQEITTM
jgi:hypothetical protein